LKVLTVGAAFGGLVAAALFIDYSGKEIGIIDPPTGEVRDAEIGLPDALPADVCQAHP
jgi:hypothetical protein